MPPPPKIIKILNTLKQTSTLILNTYMEKHSILKRVNLIVMITAHLVTTTKTPTVTKTHEHELLYDSCLASIQDI